MLPSSSVAVSVIDVSPEPCGLTDIVQLPDPPGASVTSPVVATVVLLEAVTARLRVPPVPSES